MPKHKQARQFVLSSLHVVLPLLCVVDLIESCCCCFYLNIYFFVSLSICHIKQICRRARLSPNWHTTSLFPNSVPSGEGDPKNLPLNCVLKIVFHAFLSFVLFPRPFFGDCTRLKKKNTYVNPTLTLIYRRVPCKKKTKKNFDHLLLFYYYYQTIM